MSDGLILVPADGDGKSEICFNLVVVLMSLSGLGLKSMIEMIDNRSDFKTFMQNYSYAYSNSALPRGPRRDGPREEGFVSDTDV